MAKNKMSLKLDSIRQEIRDSLKDFAEKLIEKLGDNLQSVTVVGSSLTQDYKHGQSDINTVLVLDKPTLLSLDAIAGFAKSFSRKKFSAPLLMTPAYIERSLDVFGVEFLDFQLTHQTILGSDPFKTIRFRKEDVRLQCERELKATLIRLRQGYIAAAANKKLVRDIIIAATKGLAPLLRAMLWLKNIDRPAETEPTFNKAAGQFTINMDFLTAAASWRHERIRQQEAEIRNAFQSVYTIVEQLTLAVDKLEA
jgi:hypothetical protein